MAKSTTTGQDALKLARALLLTPGNGKAVLHLAGILRQASQLPAAIDILRKLAAYQPDDPETQTQLGTLLLRTGQYTEAEAVLRRALAFAPVSGKPGIANNLAAAQHSQGRHEEAVATIRQAMQWQTPDAGMYRNLALFLQSQEKHAEAEPALRAALALEPEDPGTACDLAIALQNQGNYGEATTLVNRALQKPGRHASALLYALTFDADLSPEAFLAKARQLGGNLGADARPYTRWHTHPGSDIRRLRVGLVSGDLIKHPVSFFLENFISRLDRDRIELFVYSTRARADEFTARLRPQVAAWRDITADNDEQAAQRIHADDIHVLIDLSGHTSFNRLPVFTWRPAPVQASWLGFSTTTGVSAIDWLIVDRLSVPATERGLYSERLWYLPHARVCFTPPEEANALPPPAPRRRPPERPIVLGNFQGMAKLNDHVLALWARVLREIPAARLRIQNSAMNFPANHEAFLARMRHFGVAPDRVELAGSSPRMEYLAAHADIDFILDAFPYAGGTTTCEALWMGIPTLTLAGRTLLSRYGVTLLGHCGLDDWVAHDPDDYVRRAVLHAGAPDTLDRLRLTLRERMRQSSLCDGAAFARDFEDAMHGMWKQAPA